MTEPAWIGGRLALPAEIRAILWDMDGVLIDSLGLDYEVCTALIRERIDAGITVDRTLIRRGFALSPPDFWKFLFDELALPRTDAQFHDLLDAYERARVGARFALNPGIAEILADATARGLKMAVVSNNATADIERILENCGLRGAFAAVVGNEQPGLRKKPWPDTYLHAADRLGLPIAQCAVIEDSLIGLEAAVRSGAFAIGVATGGNDFEELLSLANAHRLYTGFAEPRIVLKAGNVLDKTIVTPNEFVSHMVEHIAWRLGASIDLHWPNDDWRGLGAALGREIAAFDRTERRETREAAVIGMIDDGSAEICLRMDQPPELDLAAVGDISLPHFIGLRCEQLGSGEPLKSLLDGLVEGLDARLSIRVCSLEDAHHTWEGVFRAIGIALNRILVPRESAGAIPDEPSSAADAPDISQPVTDPPVTQGAGMLRIEHVSTTSCALVRETAESIVRVDVTLGGQPGCRADIAVSPTIDVSGFPALLQSFAISAGLKIDLTFRATKISSSHVVLEDTALVLGAALFKILELRMARFGVNGAGSSLETAEQFENARVSAAVSVEGRKFLKLVPFDLPFPEFRRRFILGQDLAGGIRSEDMDDFFDALAGGLRASIMIHFRRAADADAATLWQDALVAVGKAVAGALAVNPLRKGLPPGVKATLI